MVTDLTKFNALRADVAECKERNKTLIFDYRDPQGNKDARSHIFKLRKTKTLITDVHKEVKAEALAACQAIDAEKRFLVGEVEEMIEVHDAPIKAIEDEKVQEALTQFQAREAKKQEEEERKQKEMADREAEVARKEAEIKAKEENMKRVQLEAARAEREKRIAVQAAEDARIQAEAKAEAEKQAVKDAAAKTIADAKAKTLAKENARLAKEATDKAEQEKLAKIERIRAANKKHQEEIQVEIHEVLWTVIQDEAITNKVIHALHAGHIPHVTINY